MFARGFLLSDDEEGGRLSVKAIQILQIAIRFMGLEF